MIVTLFSTPPRPSRYAWSCGSWNEHTRTTTGSAAHVCLCEVGVESEEYDVLTGLAGHQTSTDILAPSIVVRILLDVAFVLVL